MKAAGDWVSSGDMPTDGEPVLIAYPGRKAGTLQFTVGRREKGEWVVQAKNFYRASVVAWAYVLQTTTEASDGR